MAPQKKSKYKPSKLSEQTVEGGAKAKESNIEEAKNSGETHSPEDERALDQLDQNLRSLRNEMSELHTEIASSNEMLARVIAQTASHEGAGREKGSGPVASASTRLKGFISALFRKSSPKSK